jgi:hypothetical protein
MSSGQVGVAETPEKKAAKALVPGNGAKRCRAWSGRASDDAIPDSLVRSLLVEVLDLFAQGPPE